MDMDIVTLIKRKGKQRKKDERNGKGITIGKGNNQTTKRTKDGTKKALSPVTLNNWKKIFVSGSQTHICVTSPRFTTRGYPMALEDRLR
jgi:hypothetical protein